MRKDTLKLLDDINRAVIKFRGIYSAWSGAHGISYNEMLVLYTIREKGFCTQKQICESYLLPRQTINNVITGMRASGLLEYSKEHSAGREKAFVLSEKGQSYAAPLLDSLTDIESNAVEMLGVEKIKKLTSLLLEYDEALNSLLEEKG